MSEFFKQITVLDYGRFRRVEPNVILEVAFNGIQKSDRHDSGYALRFPRIVRLRYDKTLSEIDTRETVEKLYNRHLRNSGSDARIAYERSKHSLKGKAALRPYDPQLPAPRYNCV